MQKKNRNSQNFKLVVPLNALKNNALLIFSNFVLENWSRNFNKNLLIKYFMSQSNFTN